MDLFFVIILLSNVLARDIPTSISPSVGRLVGWSVGLLVCWSVGLLVCQSVGLMVCWFVTHLLFCCFPNGFCIDAPAQRQAANSAMYMALHLKDIDLEFYSVTDIAILEFLEM